MRVAIIDDEDKARLVLKKLLQQIDPEITILGEANSVESGTELLNDINPDVLFLDIQMDDGTGFDILKQFSEIDFDVIFTTAYDSYALDAFKVNALDYILKPIDIDDLQNAINKIRSLKPDIPNNLNMDVIKQIIQDEVGKQKTNHIAISYKNNINFVNVENIIRCESSSNYTDIFLLDGSKMTSSKILKEFEVELLKHNFFRIHNSHLINLNYILKISENNCVHMSDGSVLEISRRRKSDFLKLVSKF
ncbi:MAG: LytTR family DNA-binding domain-containing protein [Candidatus Lokiarchaeia archaeon]|nr:LytTR family DNA-binding domain-containing protein [Candidatus Lokiarchaeia archaeon]